MDTNTILSTVAIVVSVSGAIISAINHTRIRSACCGREGTISLDIEKSSPIKTAEKSPEV